MIEYIVQFPDFLLGLFQEDPLYQSLGILAFLISFVSKLVKNDKMMLYIDSMASFTWVAHFSVIGAWTGALTNFTGAIRNIASVKFKGNTKVVFIFLGIYTVIGYFTYVDWFSVFPILAAYTYTSSFFFLKGVALRWGYVLGNMFWLVYQFMNQSIGGVLTEILLSFIAIWTIYRIYRDNNLQIKTN